MILLNLAIFCFISDITDIRCTLIKEEYDANSKPTTDVLIFEPHNNEDRKFAETRLKNSDISSTDLSEFRSLPPGPAFIIDDITRKKRDFIRKRRRFQDSTYWSFEGTFANREKSFKSNVAFGKLNSYCEECDIRFTSVRNYQLHGKTNHPKKKIFPCHVTGCDDAFTEASNLIKHQRVMHGRELQMMQKITSFEKVSTESDTSKSTLAFQDSDVKFPTYCKECDEEFGSANKYEMHGKLVHPGKKIFLCTFAGCRIGFTESKNLQRHRFRKHGRRKKYEKYKLRQPAMKMPREKRRESPPNSKELNKHLAKEHPKERMYKCNQCPLTFTTRGNCTRHERATHDKTLYICKYCQRKCEGVNAMRRHQTKCEPSLRPPNVNSSSGYVCDECGRTFNKYQSEQFVNHLSNHKEYCKCPVCDVGYGRHLGVDSLKNHVLTHHPQEYDNVDFDEIFADRSKKGAKITKRTEHDQTNANPLFDGDTKSDYYFRFYKFTPEEMQQIRDALSDSE